MRRAERRLRADNGHIYAYEYRDADGALFIVKRSRGLWWNSRFPYGFTTRALARDAVLDGPAVTCTCPYGDWSPACKVHGFNHDNRKSGNRG